MNQKYINIFIVALLFGNMVLISFIIYKTTQEGAQCQVDPLIYGAKILEEANNDLISCSCSFLQHEGTLTFDGREKRASYPNYNRYDDPTELSKFNFTVAFEENSNI